MSQIFKPLIIWSLIGIGVLIVFFNQWMSAQIDRPAAVPQTPVETSAGIIPQPAPVLTVPEPMEMTEETPAPAMNAHVPVEEGPKVGERINEPIYEPPTNDVILVN